MYIYCHLGNKEILNSFKKLNLEKSYKNHLSLKQNFLKDLVGCIYLLIGHVACGVLAPGPGIEPASPAVIALNLNHWTAREVPKARFFKNNTT